MSELRYRKHWVNDSNMNIVQGIIAKYMPSVTLFGKGAKFWSFGFQDIE